jgi:hypothetical protein
MIFVILQSGNLFFISSITHIVPPSATASPKPSGARRIQKPQMRNLDVSYLLERFSQEFGNFMTRFYDPELNLQQSPNHIQSRCQTNSRETIMFNPIIKTSILVIVLASNGLVGSQSHAHPEMDAWGRDISSGPLPPPMNSEKSVPGEITGSVKAVVACTGHIKTPCDQKLILLKQRELPGDN